MYHQLKLTPEVRDIIGKSEHFLAALSLARRVAVSKSNILLTGESGTGKELFARYIHEHSRNKSGAFVGLNCSAIPAELLESELFGQTKGAFTGATEKRVGLFEEAQNGTLFLDEIGDLTIALQAKLLRVIQERQIRRVGENSTQGINCRLVAATHKDLSTAVNDGSFREDLYYRLHVIPIHIPPLRERVEDILPLANHFLNTFRNENTTVARVFSAEAIEFLTHNAWRGNVRELEHTIERAVILCDGPEIKIENFMPVVPGLDSPLHAPVGIGHQKHFSIYYDTTLPILENVIHEYVKFAVAVNGGARDRTAIEIGIDRKTLSRKLQGD